MMISVVPKSPNTNKDNQNRPEPITIPKNINNKNTTTVILVGAAASPSALVPSPTQVDDTQLTANTSNREITRRNTDAGCFSPSAVQDSHPDGKQQVEGSITAQPTGISLDASPVSPETGSVVPVSQEVAITVDVSTSQQQQPIGTSQEGVVAVTVVAEPPTTVSEQRIAAEEASRAASGGGWLKQNMAKVRSNLFGPLHVGDALFSAWVFFLMILAATATTGIKYFWLFLFFLFYFSYLHSQWKCDERQWVWNMLSVEQFEVYWQQLRLTRPEISMTTESWHWERRVHHNTTYHAGGGSTTTTTVTYVRRVTHTEVSIFNFNTVVDLSLDLESSDLKASPATFVRMWKEYSFGNIDTVLAYNNQLQALKSRNQSKDAFMDTFETMQIGGWRHLVGVYRDTASRPLLVRDWIFAVACVCLLSWPMKLYLEFVTKKGALTMSKQVTQ